MSKDTESKTPERKLLPFSDAESAEHRLEELVKNKSITHFRVMSVKENYGLWPLDGECRVYPDGFEGVSHIGDSNGGGKYYGNLYLERRRAYVVYDLENDQEMQKSKVEGE